MLFDIVTAIATNVSVKDVLAAGVAIAVGWGSARIKSRSDERTAKATLAVQAQEQLARDATANIETTVKREATQSENLTQRFKVLMDGYEGQVTFLTSQVQALRSEVATVQATLDAHRTRCAGCPHFMATHAPA